jgi:hypothetical protein
MKNRILINLVAHVAILIVGNVVLFCFILPAMIDSALEAEEKAWRDFVDRRRLENAISDKD